MPRTVKLRVSYNGDRFAGSQMQTGQRTVQGELEAAWARCTGYEERITLAGRTDAGVHAREQVGSVATQSDIAVGHLEKSLAGEMPEDLRVGGIVEMPWGFNARTSARWRMYEYDLASAARTFLHRGRMQEAASRLLGEHDFMAFASQGVLGPRGAVRRLHLMAVREGGDRGQLLVVADAFLRQMVRRLVGALVAVGTGKIGTLEIERALLMREPRLMPAPAPPGGLTLVRVGYQNYTGETL